MREGRCETACGDGKFLYHHHKVYLTEKEAEDYALQHTSPDAVGYKYYVRSIRIEITESGIEPVECYPDTYEHYHLLDVLKDLENLPA